MSKLYFITPNSTSRKAPMQIQNTHSHNQSFGIKVPTKQVIDFVSGVKSSETSDVFFKVTGQNNDRLLSTMNDSSIDAAKNYCAKQISIIKPEFKNLVEIQDNIMDFVSTSLDRRNGGILTKVVELFNAKDAEKAHLLETLPESIDIPKINLHI